MNHEKMIATVSHIMSLLVQGLYDEIERLTEGVRMNATELKVEVDDNGQILAMPPDDYFKRIYDPADNCFTVVEIRDAQPRQWHVTADLWTEEQEFADISLELIATDNDKKLYDVQVDNLHML